MSVIGTNSDIRLKARRLVILYLFPMNMIFVTTIALLIKNFSEFEFQILGIGSILMIFASFVTGKLIKTENWRSLTNETAC